VVAVIVADSDPPSAGRCLSGHGNIAAQVDQDSRAQRRLYSPCRPVGGKGLGGSAKVELNPRGKSHAAIGPIYLDGLPAWNNRPGSRGVGAGRNRLEIAVITNGAHRAPYGGIHEPVRHSCGPQRYLYSFNEELADQDGPTFGGVNLAEFGVGSKSAAGPIDGRQLLFQQLPGHGQEIRVRGEEGGRRSQGLECS
jgi:hypothetical protein